MKCFHFTNGERSKPSCSSSNNDEDSEEQDGVVSRASSKVSWARSLSVASTNVDTRRSEFDSESRRDWVDSFDFFTQRRSNDLRVFSFAELKSATRGFSRTLMIGEGGFGSVYRGIVKVPDPRSGQDCEMDVAVKQLNRHGFQGHKEWINEVNFLGVVNHPNLVKLVGYCAEDDERGIQRLLVYEYMPKGSVENHLSTRSETPLSWATRLKIAQDSARGLAYLHEEMDFQIIFRDFKSSNILLDDEWNAKLSDFGLARLGPEEGLTHVSTAAVGTLGYAAPEYIQSSRLTSKSDVYSYGVFLYELITGRRPFDRNRPRNEQKLLEWVKPHLSEAKKFQKIIDPRLEDKHITRSAHKLSIVANRCLARHPKTRPKMSEVLEMVNQIIEAFASNKPERQVKSQELVGSFEESEDKKSGRVADPGWLARTWSMKLEKEY